MRGGKEREEKEPRKTKEAMMERGLVEKDEQDLEGRAEWKLEMTVETSSEGEAEPREELKRLGRGCRRGSEADKGDQIGCYAHGHPYPPANIHKKSWGEPLTNIPAGL